MLYANSFGGIFVSLVASLGLVFGFPNEQINSIKYYWLATMLLVLCARAADWAFWKKNLRDRDFEPLRVTRRFVLGAGITAVVWSAYTLLLIDKMGMIELASTIIIIAAMAGGASTVLAAHTGLAVSYAAILLVPASLLLSFAEADFRQVLGFLGLMFALVMIVASKKAGMFTQQAIKISNENADLLIQMEREKQAVNDANSNLEEKVRRRTEKIYELSNIDPLTGLFNRTAFLKDLDAFFANTAKKDEHIALLFVDLDGFKQINDTLGHAIGDDILTLTADRIISSVGDKQKICRWGGDEFLVALTNTRGQDAMEFAEALITCLSEPLQFDHNTLTVGATIGIAMFPEHSVNPDEIIRLADTAMYAQKKKEKSSVQMFSQDMKESLMREQTLKDGLAQAVERNEFHLAYQPIIGAGKKNIVAFEALLRWDFIGEVVSPVEFIPIAEQYGVINQIGAWVLKTACREISQLTSDVPLGVSVNVSVIQLLQPNFIEILQQALNLSRLDPKQLHLEITESIFAQNLQLLKKQVEQIQTLGVRVSIDDFGTGFSSLSHLQNLGVNMVKIDRSFIWDINCGGLPIIQATLHIAKELNCEVVAEGVETKEQAAKLTALGIPYLQGFYYAKPMLATDIHSWLDMNKRRPA